jgi:hypothetical protein
VAPHQSSGRQDFTDAAHFITRHPETFNDTVLPTQQQEISAKQGEGGGQ